MSKEIQLRSVTVWNMPTVIPRLLLTSILVIF